MDGGNGEIAGANFGLSPDGHAKINCIMVIPLSIPEDFNDYTESRTLALGNPLKCILPWPKSGTSEDCLRSVATSSAAPTYAKGKIEG